MPTTGSHNATLPCALSDLLANGGQKFGAWVDPNNPASPDYADIGPTRVPRRCKGTAACAIGSAKTRVKIRGTKQAYLLDLDNFSQYGMLVGVILQHKKLGKYEEYRYHVKPTLDTAYLVVEPGSLVGGLNTGKWSFVQMVNNSFVIISNGTYKRCYTDEDKPTATYAGFGTCDTKHALARQAFNALRIAETEQQRTRALNTLDRAMKTSGLYDDTAWLSCVHGCCVADQ